MEKWIAIRITDEMKRIASKDKYKEITNGREYILPTSKFWAGENQFQNFIGNIGELVFEQYLKQKQLTYQKDILYSGRGDYFDFKINGKTFDVKTGHLKHKYTNVENLQSSIFPKNYKFFISEKQIPKHVDYYVNIQLHPDIDIALIIGYIPKEDALKYPVVKTETMLGSAYAIPLNNLIPIYTLLSNKESEVKVNMTLDDWL